MSHRALGQQFNAVRQPDVQAGYAEEENVRTVGVIHLEHQGQPVGHISWSEHHTGLPYVEHLYVGEEHRGKGLTGQLYEAAHRETGRPLLHYDGEQESAGTTAAEAHTRSHPEMHRWLGFESSGSTHRAVVRPAR